MKNYYEILGVKPSATNKEISKVYKTIPDQLKTSDQTTAYSVLIDSESRKKYDEELKAYNEKKPNKKIKIFSGACILATASICLVIGMHGCKEKEDSDTTKKPSVSSTVKPTLIPEVTKKPVITVTPVATVTPVPTVTSTPEVGMTSKDIEEIATIIYADVLEKGMSVTYDNVEKNVALANLEFLSNTTLVEYFENTDDLNNKKDEKDLLDVIATNNIINATDETKYYRISELVGNQTDKEILCTLEDCYLDLVQSMTKGTLTNKEYQNIVNNICAFYFCETDYMNTTAKSDYDALSLGARKLAERCLFPTINMQLNSCQFLTDENIKDLKRLQLHALDGGHYKDEMICYVESVLEDVKNNQKTK